MKRGKKDNWMPVYGDKWHRIEKWANVNGSNLIELRDHSEGPSNEAYRAAGGEPVISPTEKYRENYEKIQWEKK